MPGEAGASAAAAARSKPERKQPQAPSIIPIPGITNPAPMNENFLAGIVRLTADELREINGGGRQDVERREVNQHGAERHEGVGDVQDEDEAVPPGAVANLPELESLAGFPSPPFRGAEFGKPA